MRYFLNLLGPGMALILSVACSTALAQTPTYKLGRAPSAEEIQSWDVAIGPEGKELPPGHGTAQEGAKLYAQKCAGCHGPTGTEGETSAKGRRPAPPLVGGQGTLNTPNPVRTIGSFWPFATTVWDYVYRTMPWNEERSLSADEVYAVTAFLLYRNGIIQESDVLDARSLPKIQMPNRNGFVPPEPVWKAPSGNRSRTP